MLVHHQLAVNYKPGWGEESTGIRYLTLPIMPILQIWDIADLGYCRSGMLQIWEIAYLGYDTLNYQYGLFMSNLGIYTN